jgi:hypothetical protein
MMNPIKYLPAVNDPVVIQVGANIEVARLDTELQFAVQQQRPKFRRGDVLVAVAFRVQPLVIVVEPGIKGYVAYCTSFVV